MAAHAEDRLLFWLSVLGSLIVLVILLVNDARDTSISGKGSYLPEVGKCPSGIYYPISTTIVL